MKAQLAFYISVARGFVISGIFIMALPTFFSPSIIWFAMPITELITFLGIVFVMKKLSLNDK